MRQRWEARSDSERQPRSGGIYMELMLDRFCRDHELPASQVVQQGDTVPLRQLKRRIADQT
jgi:hypothetical protein